MRIISGKYKSRRIKVSPDLKAGLLPILQRKVFDILNNLLTGKQPRRSTCFRHQRHRVGNGVVDAHG